MTENPPTPHGRRARRAHNPTAAFWWGTAKWCALIGASAALGVALALVGAEAIFHGRWTVTAEAASVAFVGVVLGALAAVAHALMVHAIDGPPGVRAPCPCGTHDPWELHPTPPVKWTDEPLTAAQLNAQVRGNVLGAVNPVTHVAPQPEFQARFEDDDVDDDVRADARQHADEDDPFGVIGGAP